MKGDKINHLAEKIAAILESEATNPDFASLFASIEKINHRLDKLEKASANPQSEIHAPQLKHPSLEKFSIAEAVADAIIDAKSKEKTCTFEPNGRPCDHCSICSSRGF
jgi:hypothetical protein